MPHSFDKQKIKIYFMPAWGETSEVMFETLKFQTPGHAGKWKNMEATLDIEEVDYYIVQDYTDAPIPDVSRVYYFSREPIGGGRIDHIPNAKKFSFLDESSYLYTKWVYPRRVGGVAMSYDTLSEMSFEQLPIKEKKLICVQSNKTFLDGHKKRVNFIRKFVWEYGNEIELFGNIRQLLCYGGQGADYVENKFNKQKEYQYCLAFDNGQYKNYFGTQFTDAILSWTVPIYWGCTNMSEFFPEGSYITFDATNPTETHRIHDIVKNSDYEKRIPALSKARELILNKYNIWPTIHEAITTGKNTWGKINEIF